MPRKINVAKPAAVASTAPVSAKPTKPATTPRVIATGKPAKPAVATVKPAPVASFTIATAPAGTLTVNPAVAKPAPSPDKLAAAGERRSLRDASFLDRARYSTDAITAATAQYIPLFAAAAKAFGGTFQTSRFRGDAAYNPAKCKNYRARAHLLVNHGVLNRGDNDTFSFVAAITDAKTPDGLSHDMRAAYTAYHNAKPLAAY